MAIGRFYPFVIDDDFRAEVMRVLEYASTPANYYVLATAKVPPGDVAEYLMLTGDYKVVYSVTVAKDGMYRHMTVSLQRGDAEYPSPTAVFTIAHMFGFTGADVENGFVVKAADRWRFNINRKDYCIVVVEAMAP